MKKLQNLLLLAALFAFAATAVSCSDDDEPVQTEQNGDNGGGNGEEPDPDPDPDPVPTPDGDAVKPGEVRSAAYIYGYPDNDDSKVAVELVIQSKSINSDGQTVTGSGVQASVVLGANLPTETSVITLADGTYNYSEDFTDGVLFGGAILIVDNGQVTDQAMISSGSVTIKGKGELQYTVAFNVQATTKGGKNYTLKETYDLPILPLYENEVTTLESDIETTFAQCYMGYMGTENGLSQYLIELVNIGSDKKPTEICDIFMFAPADATSGVPAHTYSNWVDIPYQYITSIPEYTCVAGLAITTDSQGNPIEEPEFAYSWYMSLDHMVRLAGGTFTVAYEGQTCKITGAVEDYFGQKIGISFTGNAQFVDMTQNSQSVKSLRGARRMPATLSKVSAKLSNPQTHNFQIRALDK